MKYRLIKEKIKDSDVGTYVAYGIAIIHNAGMLRKISDISRSYKSVRRLCTLCNRLKLDVRHIDDIVQDYLTDI